MPPWRAFSRGLGDEAAYGRVSTHDVKPLTGAWARVGVRVLHTSDDVPPTRDDVLQFEDATEPCFDVLRLDLHGVPVSFAVRTELRPDGRTLQDDVSKSRGDVLESRADGFEFRQDVTESGENGPEFRDDGPESWDDVPVSWAPSRPATRSRSSANLETGGYASDTGTDAAFGGELVPWPGPTPSTRRAHADPSFAASARR
jgi:hypothetical protein